MLFIISVELDYSLAKRLIDDPYDWSCKDKEELLDSIGQAVDEATAEYKEAKEQCK